MPYSFSFARHANDNTITAQELDPEPSHERPRRVLWLESMNGQAKRQEQSEEPADRVLETEEYTHSQPSQQAGWPSPQGSEMGPWCATFLPRTLLPLPSPLGMLEPEQRVTPRQCRPELYEQSQLHPAQKRNLSVSPRRQPRSRQPVLSPSASAPELGSLAQGVADPPNDRQFDHYSGRQGRELPADLPPLQIPEHPFHAEIETRDDVEEFENDRALLEDEYDKRWILNLSMHFRDNSNREKFFVTYAETPSTWRRLTVSLDYRNPVEGSLEADLSTLHFQRDKSFRIYEAIRESLPDIEYYNTVTNLKLETTPEDGQLHVHVREDANEIVQYPSTSLFQHVRKVSLYHEDRLEFVSHLSGFVYKVGVGGKTLIKKEIPGPDTVEEFQYEVNALDSLLGCPNVVQLEGLVTDNEGTAVKGLLLSYATQGALVDMLYDFRGELPWYRREKWAKQIVQGLSDIHEAGFVQGDFTISNVVIDEDDNAQIIDINRRGCPVGWEPPELGKLIESGQRIGMHIGVKTDLYQLGMVLWALAEENDEPERAPRPLRLGREVPSYYRQVVDTCLSSRVQDRLPAAKLLRSFPPSAGKAPSTGSRSVDFLDDRIQVSDNSVSTAHRSDKEYIDPSMAVTIDEVRTRRRTSGATDFTSGQVTYVDPDSNAASTDCNFDPSESWDLTNHRRGRSPVSSRRRPSSPYGRSVSSATSMSSAASAGRRLQRHAIYDDDSDGEVDNQELNEPKFATEVPLGPDDPRGSAKDAASAVSKTLTDGDLSVPPSRPADHIRATVHGGEFGGVARLLHTDSGFDELMMNEVESLGDAVTVDSEGRSTEFIRDEAVEHLPIGMAKLAKLGISELPRAGSPTLLPSENAACPYENYETRQR
ncbi:Protein tyrosine kinase [Teratosphaeria destructans]|uniref:Protein tyrosine kinase n=1 Tax=Teratosphaeria destructans TaxID=418781 RepID=A0A9W7SL07_9PEZI|nr:Protein tyrosine kinase [Teratosphaeria destructans]